MLVSIIYFLSIGVAILFLILSKFPEVVKIQNSLKSQEKVSIIIPARNEERNIGRLLASLTKLNYENYEIILVDGDSSDRTVEIATQYDAVKVIEEPDRPEGWVGKPWGCHTGYQEAKGEVLVFTDADTWHHPDSLTTTVFELQKTKGFLSFLTTQEFKSFWEHMLSIVFLIISVSTRGTKGTSKATIANGQYMMFSRSTYEELGTHKTVKGSIIEDLAFATHGASKGVPPKIIAHRNLITARMYQSLAEIREGFGKNLGLGVNQAGIDSILAAGAISTWGLGWIVVLTTDLIFYQTITTIGLFAIIIGYLSFTVLLIILEYRLSTKTTLYPIIYPLYFIVFQFIVLHSFISTFIRKEIVWKDRSYKI